MNTLMDAARQALEWYQSEAKAIAKHFAAGKDMAVLASMHALSLDGGKRAQAAIAVIEAAEQAEPVGEWRMDVTLDQAACELLFKMMHPATPDDDEYCEIRLQTGDGHSGPGLYASSADYPEEGSLLLAVPATAPPAPQAQRPVPLTNEQIDDAHKTEKLALLSLMYNTDTSAENFTRALRLEPERCRGCGLPLAPWLRLYCVKCVQPHLKG